MIDNWDICLARAELLKRWPALRDFNEISYDRAYWEAKELCDLHSRSRGIFGTLYNTEESTFAAAGQAAVWAWSRSLDTLVRKYGDGPPHEREHEEYMTSQLRLDDDSCDCPLVYASGDFRFPRIREELLFQADRRNVTIMAFTDLNRFGIEELMRFEYTHVNLEHTAAYLHRYQKLIQSSSGGRETDNKPTLALPATVDNDEQRVVPRRLSYRSRIGTTDSSEVEPQARRQLSSAAPLNDLFDRSLPLVVLIDAENIDGAIHNLHDPTGNQGVKLDRDLRLDWKKLHHWIDKQVGEQSALVAPVLAFSEAEKEHLGGVSGFAQFLSNIGLHPLAFKREDGRSVVDEGINKILLSLVRQSANVMLLSHDGDFFRLLEKLRSTEGDPERHIAVAGFPERMNSIYHSVDWLRLIDIEHDMNLFSYRLPNRSLKKQNSRASNRVDDFDADAFLAASGLFPQLQERGGGA